MLEAEKQCNATNEQIMALKKQVFVLLATERGKENATE